MRLIDANEAKRYICETFIGASDFARDTREAACLAVDNAPTIEPVRGEWVSVEERLPTAEEYQKNDSRFIVTDGNRTYQALFDIYDSKKFCNIGFSIRDGLLVDDRPTHWMPLPEPPKEGDSSGN